MVTKIEYLEMALEENLTAKAKHRDGKETNPHAFPDKYLLLWRRRRRLLWRKHTPADFYIPSRRMARR